MVVHKWSIRNSYQTLSGDRTGPADSFSLQFFTSSPAATGLTAVFPIGGACSHTPDCQPIETQCESQTGNLCMAAPHLGETLLSHLRFRFERLIDLICLVCPKSGIRRFDVRMFFLCQGCEVKARSGRSRGATNGHGRLVEMTHPFGVNL